VGNFEGIAGQPPAYACFSVQLFQLECQVLSHWLETGDLALFMVPAIMPMVANTKPMGDKLKTMVTDLTAMVEDTKPLVADTLLMVEDSVLLA
jgi:hypothetical protein